MRTNRVIRNSHKALQYRFVEQSTGQTLSTFRGQFQVVWHHTDQEITIELFDEVGRNLSEERR